MAVSRLELSSVHGDQTLSGVRFVLHGTSNPTDTVSIRDAGLDFVEGQAVATTNLAYAANWASGPDTAAAGSGSMFVIAMPPNLHLGYAVFTTAYIDRELKRVSGAPLRFASARSQLAVYKSPDTEASRVHIESEVANGYPLAQQPHLTLEPQYVVGSFEPGPDLTAMLRQLEGTVANLQALDSFRLERSLVDLFLPSQPAHAVLAPPVVHTFVNGTVESLVISRLRLLRWRGLASVGYRFFEGKEPVTISPARDVAEQRTTIEDLNRRLASSELFVAELSWLKTFAIRQLALMKIELDGASLEIGTDSPDWQNS